MRDRERRRLLDRVDRPSAGIGGEMPDELDVQGTTIDLTAFVFECKRLDAVPESKREEIESVTKQLQRERLQRKQRIEDGDLSLSAGETLVESIHGIDRALTALDGLDDPDIGEAVRRKQLEDARELLALVDASL